MLFCALLSLLTLTVAAVTPEQCSWMVNPITVAGRTKLFDTKWVLMDGFTSDANLEVYLAGWASYWVEMTDMGGWVSIKMRGKHDGACYGATTQTAFMNANTFTDEVASFYQTCADCLVIDFKPYNMKAFLFFGKSGASLTAGHLAAVGVQAQCLGYSVPAAVQYNENEALCPENPANTEEAFENLEP